MICLDQAYFPGFYFVLFGFFLFFLAWLHLNSLLLTKYI